MRSRLPRALRAAALALASAAIAVATPAPSAARHAVDTTNVVPLSAQIVPSNPCAGELVRLIFATCGPCARIESVDTTGTLHVVVSIRPGQGCPPPLCPTDTRSVNLGLFAAGSHTIVYQVTVRTVHADSSVTEFTAPRQISWLVRPECGPGNDPLPYVDAVVIGTRPAPCDSCPPEVCPGDSVRVRLEGRLPSPCWSVRSVEWLPLMNPLDLPVLRVTVADSTCSPALTCGRVPTPWSATRWLPPMPPGPHPLMVQVAVVSCLDSLGNASVPPPPAGQTFTYTVLESCGLDSAFCVEPTLGIFDNRVGDVPCDVFVGRDGIALADLQLRTSVAVAGLQGIVRVSPGNALLGLEPVDMAGGMQLVTRPPEDGGPGLDFVLFSTTGQVIPAGTRPILRARVLVTTATAFARVVGHVKVASDSVGGEVPLCIHIAPAGRPVGICPPPHDVCDANFDGVTNVRDLVVMARCLRSPAFCPVDAPTFDCTQDDTVNVRDIICCARHILGNADPDTLPPVPVDGVALTFGAPQRTDGGVELPLVLSGADRIGAAVFTLEFPADRYELDGVVFEEHAEWLQLSDGPVAGRAQVGLVALGASASAQLPVTLRLRIKAGAAHGGAVSVQGCELSSTEGARIAAPMTREQPLVDASGGAGGVALSAARPNPSAGLTRFVVTLPRAATVDLGVFDLSGRRVATLARGPLNAGAREFAWSGKGARDGVYFARLVVDGRTYGTRVTLLKSE
jgi:hypothetical protein